MDDEGEVLEVQDDSDVTDTDDGGAIVRVAEESPPDTADKDDFYGNLAEKMIESDLESFSLELIERIDYDKEARKDRDKQQADAIKRTGLGNEAPGGATFMGASRVVHPMIAKAAIDFGARAISELMPPGGPVKDFIPGESTKGRVEKARRKTALMNWQFKKQMPEWRNELEQLLNQLPLGGSQYMRLLWDERKRRPVPTFVAVDDVYIPYAASSFYTAERVTYVEHITQAEFDRRVESGEYRDVPVTAPTMTPDQSESEKAVDKVEGKESDPYNEDGLRAIYVVETNLEGVDPSRSDSLPYIVVLDEHNHKILSIVRNWEKEDKTFDKMYWLVEFIFLPFRGSVGASLGQLIGSLAGATTGAIRALLDSAHVNNIPTLLALKGANFSGQSLNPSVGQVTQIEGGVAGDTDIRKLVMAIPFNEPSLVLLQLIGLLTSEADSVVRTTFEKLAESKTDMPVGTTLALIEQGMKVMSSIHLRMHNAMDRVVQLLHRINKMYITDDEIIDETGELLARRSDFEGPLDVIPVSDPEIFSDVQRFAQMQIIAERAMTMPMLYDLRKVEEMILARTKIPDAESLLLPAPVPKEMNQVNENVAMSLGRPVAAFPDQDHLAHIQCLIDFYVNPFFGANPIIAPVFIKVAVQHLAEHMLYWYVNAFVEEANNNLDGQDVTDLMKYKDPKTRKELDRLLATISPLVMQKSQKVFAKLGDIIKQMMQAMQALAPPMPQDPGAQASLAVAQVNAGVAREDIASREKTKMAELTAKQADARTKQQTSAAEQQLKATEGDKERANRAAAEQLAQSAETERTAATIESDEARNTQDNWTALHIADGEFATKEKVAVSKGTGTNPNKNP